MGVPTFRLLLAAPLLAGAVTPPMPDGPPRPLPQLSLPAPSVPLLMHDLGATVMAEGTQVGFQADLLFDGTTATLHDDAPGRLVAAVQLIRQIHPSGLRLTGRDPSDPSLARRRAASVQAWLADAGLGSLKLTLADAVGAPGLDLMILR